MRLVKYDCGCIGFEPDENGDAIIIRACDCDFDDDEYYIFARVVKNKSFEIIDNETKGKVIRELNNLLYLGYRLRDFKRALK